MIPDLDFTPIEAVATIGGRPLLSLREAGRQPVVYRIWAAREKLLYVGSTDVLRERLSAHSTEKRWYRQAIGVTVQPCDSLDEARQIEAEAIWLERPRHNKRVDLGQRPLFSRHEKAMRRGETETERRRATEDAYDALIRALRAEGEDMDETG